MQENKTSSMGREYLTKKQRRKKWKGIVAVLGVFVIIATISALTLPAVTMNHTVCGLEEHQHGDACYALNGEKKLVCTPETIGIHQHTETCYDGEGNLTCGQADFIIHTHDNNCYDSNDSLVCTLPEIEEHIHGEGCFVEEENNEVISCQQIEVKRHQHTEECFQTENILICQLQEHTHTDECKALERDALLTDEESQQVNDIISIIEGLPPVSEIEEQFIRLEEEGDSEELNAYREKIIAAIQDAFDFYNALSEKQKEAVTNASKLDEYKYLLNPEKPDSPDKLEYVATSENIAAKVTLENVSLSEDAKFVIDTVSREEGAYQEAKEKAEKYLEKMDIEILDSMVFDMHFSDKNNQEISNTGKAKVTLKFDEPVLKGQGDVFLLHIHSDSDEVADVLEDVTEDENGIREVVIDTDGFSPYLLAKTSVSAAAASQKPVKNNTSKLDIVQGADTNDLIEVNLYDYGTNINEKYNGDKNYPGFQQDNGSIKVTTLSNQFMSYNFGNNITSDLSAGITEVTNQGGQINTTVGKYGDIEPGGANLPIENAISGELGSDGYPALTDGTSLSYLFSNNTYATKKNKKSVNGLFQHNAETGAYTFNSRENHAQFNENNDTFTLYKQLISSNFMMYPFGNFLPFNDITTLSQQSSLMDRAYFNTIANSAQEKYGNGYGNEYETLATQLKKFIGLMDEKYGTDWKPENAITEYFNAAKIGKVFSNDELKNIYTIDYDEPTDFYFGMEMKMNFMQPKNGITGPNNDQNMIFYFTGDDDVYVYIDGKLFLDLSGIHRHVGGEIDFVNGVVKYYYFDKSTGDVSTEPYKTVTFEEILGSSEELNETGRFKDYSTHSFNFYYMERGAGSGVCRMNFNFPLLRRNAITIKKELSVDSDGNAQELLGNPDFKFQVLKEGGTELFIAANKEYTILDEKNEKIGTGITDENGIITLKANQSAVFSDIEENAGKYLVRELLNPDSFEQYGKITINGSTQTTETGTNIKVGEELFTGVNSPVTDMSTGSTIFNFNNQIALNKMGSLEISKKLEAYSENVEEKEFEFTVTLDGEPLKVGTPYTVKTKTSGDSKTDVSTVQKTVQNEGIIILKADETATISNIIAGSKFTVQEMAASASGYNITYFCDDANAKVETDENGTYISGLIKANTAVKAEVKNSEKGAVIEIPGTKILENPDGQPYQFDFEIQEVTDCTGQTKVENGLCQAATVNFSGSETEKSDAKHPFSFKIIYQEKQGASYPMVHYYKITEKASALSTVQTDFSSYVAKVTLSQENNNLKATLTALYKNGQELELPTGNIDDNSNFSTQVAQLIQFKNTLVGDLTVEKKISGIISPDQEFNFKIRLTKSKESVLGAVDEAISGTFKATKTAVNEGETGSQNISFDNSGIAVISLKGGEKLTIHKIPIGTKWTVTEEKIGGCKVSCQTNSSSEIMSGNDASGTVSSSSTVIFTNHMDARLPDTGGNGTDILYIIGVILTVGATFLFAMKQRKRMR